MWAGYVLYSSYCSFEGKPYDTAGSAEVCTSVCSVVSGPVICALVPAPSIRNRAPERGMIHVSVPFKTNWCRTRTTEVLVRPSMVRPKLRYGL